MRTKSSATTDCQWYYEVCLGCSKCVLGGLRPTKHSTCSTSKWVVCWQCNTVTELGQRSSIHAGHKLLPENEEAIKAGRRMAVQAAEKKKQRADQCAGELSQDIRGVLAQQDSDDDFISSDSKATKRK